MSPIPLVAPRTADERDGFSAPRLKHVPGPFMANTERLLCSWEKHETLVEFFARLPVNDLRKVWVAAMVFALAERGDDCTVPRLQAAMQVVATRLNHVEWPEPIEGTAPVRYVPATRPLLPGLGEIPELPAVRHKYSPWTDVRKRIESIEIGGYADFSSVPPGILSSLCQRVNKKRNANKLSGTGTLHRKMLADGEFRVYREI